MNLEGIDKDRVRVRTSIWVLEHLAHDLNLASPGGVEVVVEMGHDEWRDLLRHLAGVRGQQVAEIEQSLRESYEVEKTQPEDR